MHSDTPEEVVLSILCDFGGEQPEQVIRQILQHLLKLVGRVPRLKKYQKQLHILSRLRELDAATLNEFKAMPIQYDIHSDTLYLEGIEKDIEKQRHQSVVNLLKLGKLSLEEIAIVTAVTVDYVLEVQRAMQAGNTKH